jgi:protein gp37
MGQGSTIEWTESTWNPVTGCDKVSPGCKYCYAERMAEPAIPANGSYILCDDDVGAIC